MPKKDVEKVINSVDDQLADIAQNFVKRRRDTYEKALKSLKEKMKADTIRYAELLDAGKISVEDFDLLIKGRAAQLKVEVLEQSSVTRSKFDLMAGEMTRVLIKSTIEVIAAT